MEAKQGLMVTTAPYRVEYQKIKEGGLFGNKFHLITVKDKENIIVCDLKIPGSVKLNPDVDTFTKEFTEVIHRIYKEGFFNASQFIMNKKVEENQNQSIH